MDRAKYLWLAEGGTLLIADFIDEVGVRQLWSDGPLISMQGLLDAPQLRELLLIKRINVSMEDVDGIIKHPAIKQFSWFAEDVPNKVWKPVAAKIGLPPPSLVGAEKWFGLDE